MTPARVLLATALLVSIGCSFDLPDLASSSASGSGSGASSTTSSSGSGGGAPCDTIDVPPRVVQGAQGFVESLAFGMDRFACLYGDASLKTWITTFSTQGDQVSIP